MLQEVVALQSAIARQRVKRRITFRLLSREKRL